MKFPKDLSPSGDASLVYPGYILSSWCSMSQMGPWRQNFFSHDHWLVITVRAWDRWLWVIFLAHVGSTAVLFCLVFSSHWHYFFCGCNKIPNKKQCKKGRVYCAPLRGKYDSRSRGGCWALQETVTRKWCPAINTQDYPLTPPPKGPTSSQWCHQP